MMKLGDKVEKILKSVGIDPPPNCGCRMRKDWLNCIPNALMLGGIPAAKQAHSEWKARWDKPR